jgi:hypothetical protein
MKKLFLTVAAIFGIAILMTGCPKPAGGDDNIPESRHEVSGKFGTWSAPYEVGDIVFSDGSATPYTANLTLTDEQKAGAIAVIFYKGSGLNNQGISKTRTLGMGIYQSTGTIDWCADKANAKNMKIKNTFVSISNFSDPANINDGSNNFSLIGQYIVNPDPYLDSPKEDDTGNPDLYPAFYFAINYKTYEDSHVEGSSFENSWYIPSISELKELWNNFTTVKAANTLCGGTAFRIEPEETDKYPYYWSSSYTIDCDAQSAATISFDDGYVSAHKKSLGTDVYYAPQLYALVIREF